MVWQNGVDNVHLNVAAQQLRLYANEGGASGKACSMNLN